MKINGIITRELMINGTASDISGLKLVRLKEKLELSGTSATTELIIDYSPEILPFDGIERPFTIIVDNLKIWSAK